jgi:hypothetical protein
VNCISDLDFVIMEATPGIERCGPTLIFSSGKPGVGWVAFLCALIFAAALAADSSDAWSIPTHGGAVIGILLIAGIIGVSLSRQWTAEIDMAARRLKISRRSLGRWTKTVVDCPLDECTAFGTIEYNTEGQISYGAYVQLKSGRQHAIPLKTSAFKEAAKVASQLSAATGIPRLDTRF